MVILDNHLQPAYSCYRRHHSDTQGAIVGILEEALDFVGDREATLNITGSAGLKLAERLGVPFIQEVIAVRTAVETFVPRSDVVIELGGEDAKIVYLTGAVEERMNGSCAGGTGAFIDQMATLLRTDASGLDALAAQATTTYPIAARCGVFAKSDVQPLLNDGARKEDIAASVLQSVVTQTISGLACGRPIRGNVVFLGGPLNYLPQLRERFAATLSLEPEAVVSPSDSHLFVAVGAALASIADGTLPLNVALERLRNLQHGRTEIETLDALFESETVYAEFKSRHAEASVPRQELALYRGDAFLGIDAGSTTFKLTLVGKDGQLLHTHYGTNRGDIVGTARDALLDLYRVLPDGVTLRSSVITGYGEALLQAAFRIDHGEIETIAHARAAREFASDTDFVLDIGGQDMKCLHLSDGVIDKIMLNEACSSGCGSFLETFAESLDLSMEHFVFEALFAEHPVDLGSRCTVFMNSRVKQAQKEGATVADIAAGLCYSVIKNALYKVIRINDFSELGKRIVVQGGTFANDAVLRAFEQLTGQSVVRPDIAGLMGAWGAALLARDRSDSHDVSDLVSHEELEALTVEHKTRRCRGCVNTCTLTISRFDGSRTFTSGHRCDRGLSPDATAKRDSSATPNLFQYKYERVFDYEPLSPAEAPNGVVGIPRALNMYENYPFWFTLFTKLGFRVVLSEPSTKETYEAGIDSMPSESVCYPAKLSHGHVENLIALGVRRIFMPCIRFERAEDDGADNHFNCPIVQSYPEALSLNLENLDEHDVDFRKPFLPYQDRELLVKRMHEEFADWGVDLADLPAAIEAAQAEDDAYKADVETETARALQWIEESGGRGIVLSGRPYHADPEINHGIPQMIAGFGLAVLPEDGIAPLGNIVRPIRIFDQWLYHTRIFAAATVIAERDDLELVQLNSFGCGIDALVIDQVNEILAPAGKIHTVLKIDEINNVGAARIRIRSLLAALNERDQRRAATCLPDETAPAASAASTPVDPADANEDSTSRKNRTREYTKGMKDEGWTILSPQMAPMQFDPLVEVFQEYGYNVELLEEAGPGAVEEGLRHVNNDACYPALMAIGQVVEALKSGEYDVERTAVIITQTGGICRATNYIALLRKALADAGLSQVPVISLNPANTGDDSPGFKIPLPMLIKGLSAIVYGDTLARCLYRTRPYEKVPGAAEALYQTWNKRIKKSVRKRFNPFRYRRELREIIRDFEALPIHEERKPRVGIVGEILVKYHPDANNHVIELLEAEGCEATVGDLMGFLIYSCLGGIINRPVLGTSRKDKVLAILAVSALEMVRTPAVRAFRESDRFEAPSSMKELQHLAEEVLSLCNLMGEGWLLTGEMRELALTGAPNVVCVQPFGCLPNHVVGKGVIKEIRKLHPDANVVAVDYDPGASEVNQMNRIKLMVSIAKERHYGVGNVPRITGREAHDSTTADLDAGEIYLN